MFPDLECGCNYWIDTYYDMVEGGLMTKQEVFHIVGIVELQRKYYYLDRL